MTGDRWRQTAQLIYRKKRQEFSPSPLSVSAAESSAYHRVADILALSWRCSLLDVGCGPGRMASVLHHDVHFYCGVDISWDNIVQARRYNQDSCFIQADMTALPFSHTFNYILALTSLEFICDKSLALDELYRLLHDTGMMYIEVRNSDFVLFKLAAPVMDTLVRWGLIVPYQVEGFRDLRFDEWQVLLKEHGFRIIRARRSVRPLAKRPWLTLVKELLIKSVAWLAPVRMHYMVGFVCIKQTEE